MGCILVPRGEILPDEWAFQKHPKPVSDFVLGTLLYLGRSSQQRCFRPAQNERFFTSEEENSVLPTFCLCAVRDWAGPHGGVASVTVKLLSQIILRVERALDVSEGGSKLLLALRADGNHRRHAEPLRNTKIAYRL